MPSYASAAVDGLAVFYELMLLDEAIADELAAGEQYRQEPGERFDEYLASRLEIVRATYEAGLAWGWEYSPHASKGEFGSYAILEELHWMSQVGFHAAREGEWMPLPRRHAEPVALG